MAQIIDWFAAQGLPHDQARSLVAATLRGNAEVETLRKMAATGTVTLLYGSRNREFNHARVLAEVVET